MSEVAGAPVEGPKTNKEKNKERLAKLKEAQANRKAEKVAGAADQPTGEKKEKKAKAVKTPKPCRCGCGGQTTAFFVPGHDARWKGWMKKIEGGKMEPKGLPAGTSKMYTFTKRGIGYVPTKNYNDGPYVPQLAESDVAEE